MKTTTFVLIGLLLTFSALATLEMLFPGYDRLQEISPDIIIARCTKAPQPLQPNKSIFSDANTFTVEIVAAVKGTNHSGPVLVNSDHWLHPEDDYLIFGKCENGVCQALEDFRVIPLGRELYAGMITNEIIGKLPNEQLQILFKHAVDNLSREIQKDQDRKQQLEAGFKK